MNKTKRGGTIVGASSLIVIFAVLCLTIFAVLSLSTAYAGKRLSALSAQSVADYYNAELAAEEKLAEIINDPDSSKNGVYSYTCPISDSLELHVTVKLEDGKHTILRWQTVSSVDWTPDSGLDVWDGIPK